MCCDIRVLIAHSFSVTTRNCMLRRENKTNILQARGGGLSPGCQQFRCNEYVPILFRRSHQHSFAQLGEKYC